MTHGGKLLNYTFCKQRTVKHGLKTSVCRTTAHTIMLAISPNYNIQSSLVDLEASDYLIMPILSSQNI